MSRSPFVALISLILSFASASVHANRPSCRELWSNQERVFDGRESYEAFDARLRRRECLKDWTVLVYMAADNDLTPYALLDLYEMEAGYQSGAARAASTLKTDLIVQLDTAGGRGVRRLHMFQSRSPYASPSLSDFKNRSEDQIESPIVERWPEFNSADAGRLEDFLRWGIDRYPSHHYMVILWGHGQGWIPSRDGFGGMLRDDDAHATLSVKDVAQALHNASNTLGRPFEVYASDACLMQSIEAVTEISGAAHPTAPTARYLVGSSDISSEAGLPYRRLMYEINSGRFLGLKSLLPNVLREPDEAWLIARMLPRLGNASFANSGLQSRIDPNARETFTLSSVSSDALHNFLLPALIELSLNLKTYFEKNARNPVSFALALRRMPSYLGGTRDLGAWLAAVRTVINSGERTGTVAPLNTTLTNAQRALDSTIVGYVLKKELADAGYRALALWIPDSAEDYLARGPGFSASAFYQYAKRPMDRTGPWPLWMNALYATQLPESSR